MGVVLLGAGGFGRVRSLRESRFRQGDDGSLPRKDGKAEAGFATSGGRDEIDALPGVWREEADPGLGWAQHKLLLPGLCLVLARWVWSGNEGQSLDLSGVSVSDHSVL